MARIEDRWHRKDRTRSGEYGKGLRWRVVWREADGALRKKSFEKKGDAELHASKKKLDVASGITTNPDTSLSTLWPRFRATKNRLGSGSQASYDVAWGTYIEPAFGHKRIGLITPATIREWKSELRTPQGVELSPSYEGYLQGVLKALLEHAVEDRIITVNPAAKIKRPKVESKPRRYRSVAEMDRLLEAAQGEGVDLKILFLLRTGARRGEAAVVKVKNLDLKRKRVRIEAGIDIDGTPGKTKTGEHRDLPVAGELLDRLKEDIKGKGPEEFLFPHPTQGIWTRHLWRPVWNRVRKEAGLDDLNTHELRHTAISWAIAAGADVKLIQLMAGHESATMTLDLYGHLWHGNLDTVAEAVEVLIVKERKLPQSSLESDRLP